MRDMKYCDVCGKYIATDTHHLVLGNAHRKTADKLNLTLDLCRSCHSNIHSSATSEKLSKMLGQAMYEREHTRAEFVKEFGENFL